MNRVLDEDPDLPRVGQFLELSGLRHAAATTTVPPLATDMHDKSQYHAHCV